MGAGCHLRTEPAAHFVVSGVWEKHPPMLPTLTGFFWSLESLPPSFRLVQAGPGVLKEKGLGQRWPSQGVKWETARGTSVLCALPTQHPAVALNE